MVLLLPFGFFVVLKKIVKLCMFSMLLVWWKLKWKTGLGEEAVDWPLAGIGNGLEPEKLNC